MNEKYLPRNAYLEFRHGSIITMISKNTLILPYSLL